MYLTQLSHKQRNVWPAAHGQNYSKIITRIYMYLQQSLQSLYHFKHSEKILIGILKNITLALDIELEWYLYVSPLVTFVSLSPEVQIYNTLKYRAQLYKGRMPLSIR